MQFRLSVVVYWQCPSEKKKYTRDITSKTLHFFTRISVALEDFDVLISVTSCAVLSQQKEQKVWSKKAVFAFDYPKCYIEVALMLSTH